MEVGELSPKRQWGTARTAAVDHTNLCSNPSPITRGVRPSDYGTSVDNKDLLHWPQVAWSKLNSAKWLTIICAQKSSYDKDCQENTNKALFSLLPSNLLPSRGKSPKQEVERSFCAVWASAEYFEGLRRSWDSFNNNCSYLCPEWKKLVKAGENGNQISMVAYMPAPGGWDGQIISSKPELHSKNLSQKKRKGKSAVIQKILLQLVLFKFSHL